MESLPHGQAFFMDFRDRVNRVLKSCTNTFGEDVLYYPPDKNGSFKLRGIFDNDYQAIDPDTEQVISGNQPVLGVNLFDLDFEIKKDGLIKLRNLTYKIYDVREDGQGGASLLMHKCDHGQKVFKKKNSRSA